MHNVVIYILMTFVSKIQLIEYPIPAASPLSVTKKPDGIAAVDFFLETF